MRNIVILNRFPLEHITYYKWVNDDCNLYVFSNYQLYKNVSYYKELNFYNDYDINEKIILDVIELSKQIQIDEIVALSEKDVLRAGKLRSFIGVKGLNEIQTWEFRDKVAMKNKLIQSKVPVANYKPVYGITDIMQFADENDYKIVIKPRRDAGSRGVTVITNESELNRFLEKSNDFLSNLGSNFLVESLIEGELYHVDGIYHQHQLISTFVSKYLTSCLGFKENKPLVSTLVDEKDIYRESINEIVLKSLQTLGENETCIFHAEIFVDVNGSILVNEIACRIGGAKIYPTIKKVCHYDIISEYFRILCGSENRCKHTNTKMGGWVLIPPRQGVVKNIKSLPKLNWVVDYNLHYKNNQILENASSAMDRLFDAIVTGQNTIEVEKHLEEIIDYFNSSIEIVEGK